MKRITLSILSIILTMGFICNAYALTAHDLWSTRLGNQWTYMIEGQINNGHEFDVEVTHFIGGWAYLDATDEFHGTGLGDRWWFMSHWSGNFWTWNPPGFCVDRLFNLSVGKDNRFTSIIKGVPCLNKVVWTVTENKATHDTPVGTFKDCVIIDNTKPTCVDAGLTRMIFAPKVGLIEYSWATIAGSHTAKLVHAIVDGIEYKRIVYTGGYSVGLNIDKITYKLTENQMPPAPDGDFPQSPDTLKVRLKIENSTNETIEFTYSSSQEYDFIIRDDSEKEVYRWSEGKEFATVITTRTLGPGESTVFEESIELRDNHKDPIEPGNYTIEGLHTIMGEEALRQRARAGFKIELEIVY